MAGALKTLRRHVNTDCWMPLHAQSRPFPTASRPSLMYPALADPRCVGISHDVVARSGGGCLLGSPGAVRRQRCRKERARNEIQEILGATPNDNSRSVRPITRSRFFDSQNTRQVSARKEENSTGLIESNILRFFPSIKKALSLSLISPR